MATREGIYVGGHEIIERYVGSKLVWEKLDLIIKKNISYYKTSYEVGFFSIASYTSNIVQLLESADSIMIAGTLFTKITITHSFSDVSNNIYKTLNFKLTFRDSREQSAFMSLLDLNNSVDPGEFETKFYKKKR